MFLDARDPQLLRLSQHECEKLLKLLADNGEDNSILYRKIWRVRISYYPNTRCVRRDAQ